jgi:hypothetical protein
MKAANENIDAPSLARTHPGVKKYVSRRQIRVTEGKKIVPFPDRTNHRQRPRECSASGSILVPVRAYRRGPKWSPQKRKEPPGNRAAPSLGRIVPTEARPSELSGCIVGAGGQGVKNKSEGK